jgi:glycosyltransferase involved in cell wall biosynthesis
MLFIKRIEKLRPDAVLLFTSSGWGSTVEKGAMAWYARLRGVPSLMFPRGGVLIDRCRDSRFTRTWTCLMFRGACKMLCQGPAWQRFATEQMGFASYDAPLVPNWTATDNLLELGRRRIKRQSKGPVRLLFLGWLERNKGIFELLEACSQLSKENEFRLDIAGEGNASEEVREFIAARGLEDRVHLLGWIQRVALESTLSEADVLVLPSWNEGLPNAMIEAMAAGLAVVVTSVGNIPGFVVDGREVLLIPPNDLESLIKALECVINDSDLREGIASRGYLFASAHFTVEPAVNRIIQAVEDAITKPTG